MTIGKTIAVTIPTFVSRVMPLLLNTLVYHKALDRDPCDIQQGLISYFMHSISSVYMSILISHFLPPHPSFLIGIHTFVVLSLCVYRCSCLQSNRVNGEDNGTPLQYSCLENPMDGGAW